MKPTYDSTHMPDVLATLVTRIHRHAMSVCDDTGDVTACWGRTPNRLLGQLATVEKDLTAALDAYRAIVTIARLESE